jgi:putative oxidoreductase
VSVPSSQAGRRDPSDTGATATPPAKHRGHVRDDVGLLVLRIGLAAIMLIHGAQKVFGQGGLAATQASFAQLGIPYPEGSAVLVTVLELVGGLAILVGLLTPLVGLLYAAALAWSIWFVHLPHGFFTANGGYELSGLIGVVCLTLVIGGAGRLSLDRLIFGARRRRQAREARQAELDA